MPQSRANSAVVPLAFDPFPAAPTSTTAAPTIEAGAPPSSAAASRNDHRADGRIFARLSVAINGARSASSADGDRGRSVQVDFTGEEATGTAATPSKVGSGCSGTATTACHHQILNHNFSNGCAG